MTAADTVDGTDNLSTLKRAIVEIRDLKAKVAEAERRVSEPIAVVGLGLRFPGGADAPDTFWRLLSDGVDAIREVPADRWDIDALYDADPDAPGKMATRYGGFLDGVDRFDAAFFGISPREAETIDPQQRLLLEVAWEALEHAGIAPDGLAGAPAGVFLGISNSDYFRLLLADRDQIDTYTTTGNTPSIAAGRLSYVLGLQGPAVAVDTACSSSLVAVHLAAQSLRSGECDLALAGGVGLILTPDLTINFSRARMMAPDGRCKTFDAAADGYVRSEGCGVVVLKRLSAAVADGDPVLAVIRGSAVNQDGRSGGLTAPNGPSQEKVIAKALAVAGVRPEEVGYVEAHGTGTPLGDPIEVHALGSVLCDGRSKDDPLLIGSVKTNLGHMETAAGVAGLIKVVLMLQHGAIPPHLHLNELSPYIAADGFPVIVPTEATSWPRPAHGRVAGVSSFGLSGTNAHVVVGEAPQQAGVTPASANGLAVPERPLHLLALSAKSPTALAEQARRHARQLEEHPDQAWPDVAASANQGRAHFAHRLAVVAGDRAGAAEQLHALAAGDLTTGRTGHAPIASPEVGFLFTGHGSHYPGMGRQLYESQPAFRAAIDRCADGLASELDRPLTEILFGSAGLLEQMPYGQPALFAVQYALAELWGSWGIRPSVVAGHSAGEYTAAVVAGALGLADGLRLIAARGRLMGTLPAGGEMVAIFAPESDVVDALEPYADRVGIAAVNGPETTVISGERVAVRAILADLGLDDSEFRRLNISIAAHSPLIEPILDEFEQVAAGATLRLPTIGLVSSMTATLVSSELTSPEYWRRHLREPVRFAAVFDTLRASGHSTFVEIGPHPTLLGLGQRCWPDDRATWVPSLRRGADEWSSMLDGLGELYVSGVGVDWQQFDAPYARRRVTLPTYPFERESFWSPAAREQHRRSSVPMWEAASAAAASQSQQGPLDLQVETYPERFAALDQLADGYILDAVRTLGLFDDGRPTSVAEIIADGRVAATYDHLLTRWFASFAAQGLIEQVDAERYRATRPLPPSDVAALVTQAERRLTGVEPLLAYVRRCGEHLPAVLTGEESALETLFPDGSYETVDFLYRHWAVARYINGIAKAAVTAAADAHPGRTLRVLEVGAGTGGTTATLLPALHPERTSYTFTDVSDFFLVRAAERFAEHTFVRYALLDIEQSPEAQAFGAGSYDLIVAANVLHATKDLDATLANVRGLLAPGGLLLAYEATAHPRWLDMTTGLIEGWQRFEDGWRDDHPLLAPDRWAAALEAAGFTAVATLPGAEQATAVLGQHLLLARAPGDPVVPAGDADGPGAALSLQVEAELTGFDREQLVDALPEERHEMLVDLVRRAVARVLRVADPGRLDRDQPLLDLGFDSLMAVELRNVLRRQLGLARKLPATLVFDYPKIAAIATYLEALVTGDQPPADASPPLTTGAMTGATTTGAGGAEAIADLSEEEVEAMLLQKLAEI